MKIAQIKDNKVINVVSVPDRVAAELMNKGTPSYISIEGLVPVPQKGWLYNAATKVLSAPPTPPKVPAK